ncbi:MAG: hypothetical protein ACRD6W_07930, partial [Nitrososphaerales archaeon]
MTRPYPALPLVVTMGLGAALPMTATILALSLSGVQGAYHLGLPVLALVAAQQVQLGLGLDLPLALVANRVGRPRVLVGVGAIYAVFAVALWSAGLVHNQVLLYVAFIGLFVGSGSLTSTQNALLCDYYPVSMRPRLIFAQRAVVFLGLSLCPPLVALAALAFG